MVHCTECGREQSDETKFCRYCGERTPGPDLTAQLRREAAAIQQAKQSGAAPTSSTPQSSVRTGYRLGGV
ncbi:MAG TPA: zinc-ribbon domain-containing protein [Candidatus Thalassarchaeaceae archaeon]|nr:MAG TPA: zinc-ribbon domain-containing protein [Candidatus Poseidoniales archaeon]HIH84873.1 zinc-ribbon domain-containing protein [Candidatus Thalassarchaeaceae archaeon]